MQSGHWRITYHDGLEQLDVVIASYQVRGVAERAVPLEHVGVQVALQAARVVQAGVGGRGEVERAIDGQRNRAQVQRDVLERPLVHAPAARAGRQWQDAGGCRELQLQPR